MKLIKKTKYFKKGINMNRKKILKVRIKFISVLFSCCIAIIIARLYYIQLGNKSDQYVSIALNQYNFQYKTSNLNYKVLDDSNENLINYKTKYIVEIKSNIFKNFNNNIENYGGNHYETNLIRQILHTCFQFENIQSVTFLIDGNFKVLPEGNLVFKYTREDLEIMDYNQNIVLKESKK